MNNNILELDMIINNKKYSFIYSYTSILLLILILSSYIIFFYDYHTYYEGIGIAKEKDILELSIYEKDINNIIEKDTIEIENIKYLYQIVSIDENLYLDNNYQNYQKIYLKISGLNIRENQALKFKIEKKKQKIIYHILDYLERR